MSIDPKTALWINIALIVLNALVGVTWTAVMDVHTAGWVALGVSTAITVLNAILHAYSADKPGPATK